MLQKFCYTGYLALVVAIASCNSEKSKSGLKESKAFAIQSAECDTAITFYYGVRPYKLNQKINIQIVFVRNLKSAIGRFYITETYLNRKDCVLRRYDRAGIYKILPRPHEDVGEVALYNIVLGDKSYGYMYLLNESVTMVRVNDKGKEMTGEAVTLNSSDKKYI